MNGKKNEGFSFEDGKVKRPADNRQIKPEEDEQREKHDRIMSHIRQSESRKAFKKTVMICAVTALLLISIAAACFFIFRIKEVSASGSDKYTSEQLAAAAGIGKNSNLLLTSKGKIISSIRSAYPSLDLVTVKKILPDKLQIEVTDSEELYYIELGSDYFTVTDELRVTSQNSSVPNGTVELRSGGVVSAVVGEFIVFDRDTTYNYLKDLLNTVRSHKISEHIVRVDMSEKFNIRLKYEDRFIIEIGDAENADAKLTLAEAYIAALKETDRGVIYASGLENGSFRPLNEIE